MGALEKYLSDLRDIKLSGEGVSELSYYPALARLLEEIGGGLKPKVRCVMNLKNEGAGLPDGGLFAADQVRKGTLGGQKPARGAIEVKGMGDDIGAIAHSEQVLRYLEGYRQMLVTNLREFLLLGWMTRGRRSPWSATAWPRPRLSSGPRPTIPGAQTRSKGSASLSS